MSLPLAPGAALKHYRIVELLGKGGMGEVYAAEDTRLGRKVAIKCLPRGLAADPERLRRFTQEAKAASALNHPSILTIHDVDEVDGQPFLVTEFIDGQTLRTRLQADAAAIPLGEATDIAGQVANALSAAHLAGIVHRDVKPADRPDEAREGARAVRETGDQPAGARCSAPADALHARHGFERGDFARRPSHRVPPGDDRTRHRARESERPSMTR